MLATDMFDISCENVKGLQAIIDCSVRAKGQHEGRLLLLLAGRGIDGCGICKSRQIFEQSRRNLM